MARPQGNSNMYRNSEPRKEKLTQNDKLYNAIQKMKKKQAALDEAKKKASA